MNCPECNKSMQVEESNFRCFDCHVSYNNDIWYYDKLDANQMRQIKLSELMHE